MEVAYERPSQGPLGVDVPLVLAYKPFSYIFLQASGKHLYQDPFIMPPLKHDITTQAQVHPWTGGIIIFLHIGHLKFSW